MAKALDEWHRIVRERDPDGLDDLLADDVVFHSPVVHTPQRGKPITAMYLGAAVLVLGQPSFRYVREVVGAAEAVLEFVVDIDGIEVNGVDLIRWNDQGRIVDFKVMIRPLKAINLIHQKMAAVLQPTG
jgi:SnoaL-like domain